MILIGISLLGEMTHFMVVLATTMGRIIYDEILMRYKPTIDKVAGTKSNDRFET